MRVYELIVAADREEHIARHHVTPAEVEAVVFGTPVVLRARQDRYVLIGQTEAGRYLAVFLAPRGPGVYGLITARDADDRERKRFQAERRR